MSPVSLLRHLVRFGRRLRFQWHGYRFAHMPGVMGRWPHLSGNGTLTLGPRVIFRSIRTPIRIEVATHAQLTVGSDVFINDGVNIYAARQVTIGANTLIGDWAMIYDTDFHPVSPDRPPVVAPVTIGRNVWIGARAMVLAGSDIGDHSVIAAGSIVRGHVPPRSIVAGSPARIVRGFECPDDWVRP